MGDRKKQLALLAAIMGSFVAGLDATAVNVALPAIRADLGGGLAGQQWVSNAYLLTLGSLILVGGSLGDLFGERRVVLVGGGGGRGGPRRWSVARGGAAPVGRAGLAGPVLALIRQPVVGWGSIQVWGPGIAGVVLLGLFLWHEARMASPMVPLGLFKRRNFAIGNLETFAMYGGLSVTFFFLVLYLQQVAGYNALQAGLALMPSTLVMFALSKRVGRLADRLGPRLFMGFGPLTSALGLALML